MNRIVQIELVDVRNMEGLIWANMMLEDGWIILSVNELTLLLGARKDVSSKYSELREKRDEK